MSIKNQFIKTLSNLAGFSTKRKIVVIESDDWGSVRMPSLEAYSRLKLKGIDTDKGDGQRYNTLDSLAAPKDFEVLFEVLTSVKDKNGQYAKFTPVSLVANPDFEKIKQSGFSDYFYEPFTTTLEKYGLKASFEFWKKGIENKIFVPEFHGREHLNVAAWMRSLQRGDEKTRIAFEEGFWGFRENEHAVNFQAAFDLEFLEDLETQQNILSSGLVLFEELFGYSASFFVPPNGPINNSLQSTAAEKGIKFISTSKIQEEVFGGKKTKKRFHYIGQNTKYGQVYITRNCFFEPSYKFPGYSTNECLKHIETAFKHKKPAIISSHRVNYIGAHSKENRDLGARELKKLLDNIVKLWPDVEFLTTTELGNLILYDKK